MFTKCVDSSHMHVKFDNISSYPKDASNKSSGPIFKGHQYLNLFNKYLIKSKVTLLRAGDVYNFAQPPPRQLDSSIKYSCFLEARR